MEETPHIKIICKITRRILCFHLLHNMWLSLQLLYLFMINYYPPADALMPVP